MKAFQETYTGVKCFFYKFAVWCEIDRSVGRYLRGLAIEGIVVGTAAALGLAILGVNYPLLLRVVTGLANVVPAGQLIHVLFYFFACHSR